MALRLEYRTVAPEAVRALVGLNTYSDKCSIAPKLRRLVEVLVSQINGCTYCIDSHWHQALDLGETAGRLENLKYWRKVHDFSPAEKAAFAWAESITDISRSGAPDGLYRELQKHFSDVECVDLTFIVTAMNAWNRLAISFGREAGDS